MKNLRITKRTLSIIIILLMTLFSYNKSQANNIFIDDYSKSNEYEKFIKSINYNDTISDGHYLRVHGKKNLIIGCSPVVFCGNTCKDELLDKYNYDVIGFGGTKDGEIIEWLQKLNYEIKYDNIVIWGSVNDIMSAALNYSSELSDEYKTTIKTMFHEAKNHLHNIMGGKVYYINPVHMVEGLDTYIPRNGSTIRDNHYGMSFYFNDLANKVIDFIKTTNVNTIDISFDTTSENSDWYIHYTNKDVFISIFEKIKNHL